VSTRQKTTARLFRAVVISSFIGCPRGRNVEPIFFEFFYVGFDLKDEETLLFSGLEMAASVSGVFQSHQQEIKEEVA
jgi:hypothetical protein